MIWSGLGTAPRTCCAWRKWKWACAERLRRVFKGLLPRAQLEALSRRFAPTIIPWQFVDMIEVDPARRVKLRIAYERLADMHPSDLADILEDLAARRARCRLYLAR